MIESYIHILKKNYLFEGVTTSELKNMVKCLNCFKREYNKDEYISLEGEKFDSIGIIVKGSASVIKEGINGDRFIMSLLEPGDMFGEMAVFSHKSSWPASVYAQESCIVCFIPSIKIVSACNNACHWHMLLIRNLLKVISQKALLMNQKIEFLTIKSMRGKISAYLLEQHNRTGEATLLLPMNRNELADYLNVSRSSMSREMCKMRDEGIIDFHKETFRILNIEELRNC